MPNNKIIILCFLAIAFLPFSYNSAEAYNVEGKGVCNCSSCFDCTDALNDDTNCFSQVKLTTDIINQSGTCINNPANFNNKTFDCQGHKIEGNGVTSGNEYPDAGIYIWKNRKHNQKLHNYQV